jgi:hypothetical protein
VDWQMIHPSVDLQWFAAVRAPMHGGELGEIGLLSGAGEVAWQGPPLYSPDARIAPDGSFLVMKGREMRNGEREASGSAPERLVVMDRSGRTLASMEAPRPSGLECVSMDGRFIIDREPALHGDMLVGRDRSLAATWRIGPARGFAVDQWSGLIVSWAGGQVSAYLVPR